MQSLLCYTRSLPSPLCGSPPLCLVIICSLSCVFCTSSHPRPNTHVHAHVHTHTHTQAHAHSFLWVKRFEFPSLSAFSETAPASTLSPKFYPLPTHSYTNLPLFKNLSLSMKWPVIGIWSLIALSVWTRFAQEDQKLPRNSDHGLSCAEQTAATMKVCWNQRGNQMMA